MSSIREEQLPRVILPSVLRRSTIFSTKENLPKSTQITKARRVTQLPANNVSNTLKRPIYAAAIKTPGSHAHTTVKKPIERLGTLTTTRKEALKNSSLVKSVPQSTLNASRIQPPQGNKSLNRTISFARNNIGTKTTRSGIEHENKNKGPIRLFSNLQKPNTLTNGNPLTRVNPNLNRPLRSMVTPAHKTQKAGISKVNTISSERSRQTNNLKDTQIKFKPNPISLQEILSSRTSIDVTKKRETLLGSRLNSKSSTTPGKLSMSRSRMSYSYRVEKPREARASIISGALRVPRNNAKKNSRSTLIGRDMSCRKLSTIRELSVRPNQSKYINKKPADQSLAVRDASRTFTQRLPTPALRHTTTSVIDQDDRTQRKPSEQNLTAIQEVSLTRQVINARQPAQVGNSERTVESLVNPLRRMSIRRLSRKSSLINDNTFSQSMNLPLSQHCNSFTSNNNILPKVCVDEKKVTPSNKENNSQQNINILTSAATLMLRRPTQITNQVPIRALNDDQKTPAIKEIGSHKNDDLLTLAASIPLPQSPYEDRKKVYLTRESYSNNNFSSDVEKARLYEELEELEKQLEQEISEDMSEIL
ncbi:3496_t:CDS:2 [Funneliformis caledonium]|uniref:3496_t:CDS:1 n=1 Tax=Funneliformis caledonium TaxID=1117310 RepID=A0A9N9BKL4_9GLOM|nr:3496_t:CDS:2 [Funneliformis caledonium]